MTVPGSVPEDSGFGIPLASHEEVALVAVARDRDGELIVKRHVEGDGVVGSEQMRKSDFGYGVILGVAVVGSDEVHGWRQVAVAVGFDVIDGDAAEFFRRIFIFGFWVSDASVEVGFSGKRGLGAEGVEVEVKGDRG